MAKLIQYYCFMSFAKRLVELRKSLGLTQQQMADKLGINISSIKKYEMNQVQPSIEVLRKIALALHVSADSLLFDELERQPNQEFILQFEALQAFDEDEKRIAKEVIESLILKHNAKSSIQRMNQ